MVDNTLLESLGKAKQPVLSATTVDTSFVPSPFLDRLQREQPREADPMFDKEEVEINEEDGNKNAMLKYYTVGFYTSKLSIKKAKTLVTASVTPENMLFAVSWASNSKKRERSSVLRPALRPVQPEHLELKFGTSSVLTRYKSTDPETAAAKRSALEEEEEFVAYIHGTCQADGCPSKWKCGFGADALVRMCKGEDSEKIPVSLRVLQNCRHKKDDPYGQLRGEERLQKVMEQVPDK